MNVSSNINPPDKHYLLPLTSSQPSSKSSGKAAFKLPSTETQPPKHQKAAHFKEFKKNEQLPPSDPRRLAEIETQLERLEEEKESMTPINSVFEWVEWYTDYFTQLSDLSANTLEFLQRIFPKGTEENSEIREAFNNNFQHVELLSALVEFSNLGLTGLTSIYKGKILKQVEETILKVKNEYSRDDVPNSIKDWEAKLSEEKAKLSSDSVFLGVRGLRDLSYLFKFSIERLNLTALPFSHKIAEFLGIAGAVFGTIISAITLSRSVQSASTYNKWSENFKKWHAKAWPHIKESFNALNAFTPAKSTYTEKMRLNDYRIELNQLIKQSKSLTDIRLKLKNLGITLDSSITSKKELKQKMHHINFEHKLLYDYIRQRENSKVLEHILRTSESYLEKREAIAKNKVNKLMPQFDELLPQIKEVSKPRFIRHLNELIDMAQRPGSTLEGLRAKINELGLVIPSIFESNTKEDYAKYFTELKIDQNLANDPQFNQWLASQSRESLLKAYIDHQETIAQTSKNSLIEMVAKKHELEGKFIKFKMAESSISFTIGAISLTVTAVLAIIGLASIPFGGAGLLLLALSVGTGIVSLSLMGAGHYLSYRYRSSNYSLEAFTYSVNFKLFTAKIRSSIDETLYEIKRRKFDAITREIDALAGSAQKVDEKLLERQEHILEDLKKKEAKVLKWKNKIENLENRRAQQSWQDFVSYARLRVGTVDSPFDTLKAFTEAFEQCDLSLLDEETKSFFEVQLGFNIEQLQAKLKADPEAVKKTLQKFFTLGDAELISFIEQQESRFHYQSLKPLSA